MRQQDICHFKSMWERCQNKKLTSFLFFCKKIPHTLPKLDTISVENIHLSYLHQIKKGNYMKTKKIISILLCLIIITAVPITATAATWSSETIFSLTKGDGWKDENTQGYKVSDKKETNSEECRVKTVTLTMYNNPVFKIVNSNGEDRCNSFKMGNKGNTKVGNNTGIKNHFYYANLKPSALQTGTDTIKFTFSTD